MPDKTFLKPLYFVLNDGSVFIDKKLPSDFIFTKNSLFSSSYFIELFKKVVSHGNFNFNGARIKLKHCNIKVEKFRELLPPNFEDLALLQYLEFGFPLGLVDNFVLQPNLRNHSSSYDYFSHIDKFIENEISKVGLTGPLLCSPFSEVMVSPLMTAIKKPNSRRAVFDASFGNFS